MPKANHGVVGERVEDSFEFLYQLVRSKRPEDRIRLLKAANKNDLITIIEICANVLGNHFVLSAHDRRRLTPFFELVKKIRRVKTRSGMVKIVQKGEGIAAQEGGAGFLPALLVPILVELAASGGEKFLSYLQKEA